MFVKAAGMQLLIPKIFNGQFSLATNSKSEITCVLMIGLKVGILVAFSSFGEDLPVRYLDFTDIADSF